MSFTPLSGGSSRRATLLAAILGLSVLLRLASAAYHGTGIEELPGVTDQVSYHELAVRVADGHGFSFATGWWPATRANEPTAHWSFLYVLFLTAIYWVAGPAVIVARLVQALIVGVLHPLLVWRIGDRLFGPAAGLLAAAATACYGYFVFYAGALVTESFYILAVLWVLDLATLLACSARLRSRLGPWALLGLAFGVSVLLRQVFLLMVPVIVAWIGWQVWRSGEVGRGLPLAALAGRMGVAALVLAACVAPWTLRNYRVFDQVVLLNTNAGFVFFWGNHPIHGSEFVPILPNDPTVNYMTLIPRDLIRSLNEAELDRALLLRGLAFVSEDPGRYARLSLSRAKEYFKFWPTTDSSLSSNAVRVFSFGLAVPFLLAGVVLTLTRGERVPGEAAGAVLLLAVAALYSLVHLLTWSLVRYRLPMDAILMPFAGVAAAALFQRMFNPVSAPYAPLPSSTTN